MMRRLAILLILLCAAYSVAACAPSPWDDPAQPADPYARRAVAEGEIQATADAQLRKAADATLAAAAEQGQTEHEQERLMLPLRATGTALALGNEQAQATTTAAVATATAGAQLATATTQAHRELATQAAIDRQIERDRNAAYWAEQKAGFWSILWPALAAGSAIAILIILIIVAYNGSAILFRRLDRRLALYTFRDRLFQDGPNGFTDVTVQAVQVTATHRPNLAPAQPEPVRTYGSTVAISAPDSKSAPGSRSTTSTGLVLRLLRDAESVAGPDATTLPGWRKLEAYGWTSPKWQAAKGALESVRAVESKPDVGTFLVGRYATLLDLRLAIEDRKLRPGPLPRSVAG